MRDNYHLHYLVGAGSVKSFDFYYYYFFETWIVQRLLSLKHLFSKENLYYVNYLIQQVINIDFISLVIGETGRREFRTMDGSYHET